jgi:hypothetical protein
MNIFQRIILAGGTLFLWVILADATSNPYNLYGHGLSGDLWDWKVALVRGGFWVATVAAIYFAVGKKK